jgi:hypothetical protein
MAQSDAQRTNFTERALWSLVSAQTTDKLDETVLQLVNCMKSELAASSFNACRWHPSMVPSASSVVMVAPAGKHGCHLPYATRHLAHGERWVEAKEAV